MPAVGLVAVTLALTLAGCSQIAAIKPVSGTSLVEVRVATIDVLLEKGYALREVPACTEQQGGAIMCAGTTDTGDEVASTSTGGTDPSMTVTVAGETVYDGAVLEVLDRAARAS